MPFNVRQGLGMHAEAWLTYRAGSSLFERVGLDDHRPRRGRPHPRRRRRRTSQDDRVTRLASPARLASMSGAKELTLIVEFSRVGAVPGTSTGGGSGWCNVFNGTAEAPEVSLGARVFS